MRLLIFLAVSIGFGTSAAHAQICVWEWSQDISDPDSDNDSDSGSSYPSHWAWQFSYEATHMRITGNMSSSNYRCTTNLAKAASGNGSYSVYRIASCPDPQEDIEGTARNEFRARAELDDDSYAKAGGRKRIVASKMSLDCDCHGMVEATSDGPGGGSSGTTTVTIGGVSTTLYWSEGGVEDRIFQATDSGTGGSTVETITCQTNMEIGVSIGWYDDEGAAYLSNNKAELKVSGTCNGLCKRIQDFLLYTEGY